MQEWITTPGTTADHDQLERCLDPLLMWYLRHVSPATWRWRGGAGVFSPPRQLTCHGGGHRASAAKLWAAGPPRLRRRRQTMGGGGGAGAVFSPPPTDSLLSEVDHFVLSE